MSSQTVEDSVTSELSNPDRSNPLAKQIAEILPELSLNFVWELSKNENSETNRANKFNLRIMQISPKGSMKFIGGKNLNSLDVDSIMAACVRILNENSYVQPQPVITDEELGALGFYATTRM